MPRLLISGTDTTLGSNLSAALADRCDRLESPLCRATKTSRSTAGNRDARTAEVAEQTCELKPDWIIHCGATANNAWEANTPDLDERPRLAGFIATTKRMATRLTVVTSDAVFAGPRLFHDESSPRSARTTPGMACRRVEDYLRGHDLLHVRTHAYGLALADDAASFACRTWVALRDGYLPECDSFRHATPILAHDLANLLYTAFLKDVRGCLHLAGAERTNPARFALTLADVYGARPWRVVGESRGADQPGMPPETSLATRRARRILGVPMPLLIDGLTRFAQLAGDSLSQYVPTSLLTKVGRAA